MSFADDERIDWDEFVRFHKEFPRLFQPAFTLYLNMSTWIMGQKFWAAKKDEIKKIKEAERKKV